jgi:hypothetical protein
MSPVMRQKTDGLKVLGLRCFLIEGMGGRSDMALKLAFVMAVEIETKNPSLVTDNTYPTIAMRYLHPKKSKNYKTQENTIFFVETKINIVLNLQIKRVVYYTELHFDRKK